MARNRTVKSVGQVARLCLFSMGLIILILFNVSQADRQVPSSPANSSAGADQYLEGSDEVPGEALLASSNEMGEPGIFPFESFAKAGDAPYHVGIYINDEYKCGGVLIDTYRILTVRECVVGSDSQINTMQVVVGDLDKTINDGEEFFSIRRIERSDTSSLVILYLHGKVSVGLDRPTGFNPVNPISLPARRDINKANLLITGWGSATIDGFISDRLKTRIVSISKCVTQQKGYFCSRQLAHHPGICGGYTGGPVVQIFPVGSIPKLVGIIHGLSCPNECQNPLCDNLFIDISPHVKWLLDTI